MRLEGFVEKVRNLSTIPDYVLFELLGPSQSAKNLVHRWCKEGKLIRVKRGLYVLGERYRRTSPFLLYQLANNLISPSYVSLDSALSYWDLIPERIVEITSVCITRPKVFTNLLGTFSYKKLSSKTYPEGIITQGNEDETFLIACREKAILDKVYFNHSKRYFNISYLFDSLRIEENDLRVFNLELLEQYANSYPTKKMKDVAKKIRKYYGA